MWQKITKFIAIQVEWKYWNESTKVLKKKKKSTTELEWECRMRSTLRLGLGYWLMKIQIDIRDTVSDSD